MCYLDTPDGTQLLKNFAVDICGATQNWTMGNFVEQEIARIRKLVGPTGQVLGAVSGGVDSTVAAKLMHEAIGDRFTAVLVDHGYLRYQEKEQVVKDLNVSCLLSRQTMVVQASNFIPTGTPRSQPESCRCFQGILRRAQGSHGSGEEEEIHWWSLHRCFRGRGSFWRTRLKKYPLTTQQVQKLEKEASSTSNKIGWFLQGTL